MLEAALTNADQVAWLEQADMSEAERHAAYVKSDSYKAYQANMAAWQKQQEQMAWLEKADKTETERLADYKATPAYIKRAETLAVWQAEQERKKFSGYSDWEKQILEKLYKDGGPDAKHGVDFILKNRIRIKVGEQFSITSREVKKLYMHVPAIQGDWPTLFGVSGWYTEDTIFLEPNNNNYAQIPDNWALSIVIHEARHIEQGRFAFTKDGELEAYQIGLRVYMSLEALVIT